MRSRSASSGAGESRRRRRALAGTGAALPLLLLVSPPAAGDESAPSPAPVGETVPAALAPETDAVVANANALPDASAPQPTEETPVAAALSGLDVEASEPKGQRSANVKEREWAARGTPVAAESAVDHDAIKRERWRQVGRWFQGAARWIEAAFLFPPPPIR